MNDFFQYLRAMFEEFFKNFGNFFKDIFASPWSDVPNQFKTYGEIFALYSKGFGVGGWILFVIFIILVIALIGAIGYLLFILIRKFIRFGKRNYENTQLLEQIEKLNYDLYKAIEEKNKILNLKVNSLGIPLHGDEENQEPIDESEHPLRFPKLCAVDAKYLEYPQSTQMTNEDEITLDQIVERFRFFAASQLGLYYELKTLRAFFAGLGTTKIIILEGISGTGKTSLPYALGKFFQNDAKIASVQPSWRDRSELLGYYNEFTKKFNETDFLKAVYETTYRDDMNIVILDEMNLARIEYYFAEFLSIMEMPNKTEWNIELITNPDSTTDPKHFKEGKLLVPQNIWFIGTANNDDSTFTITDKVYDRAISIFFSNKGIPFECDFTEPINIKFEYFDRLVEEAANNYPISNTLLEKFDKLDSFVISKFKLAFGNRILKQLKTFVPIYVACGGTEIEGFDFIFSTKILKKFESLNITFLKDELKELNVELDKLFGKNTFVESKRVIENLIKMN